MSRLLASLLLLALLPAAAAAADASGHLKYRFNYATYPVDSLFREPLGANAADHAVETRLKFEKRAGHWDFKADHQLYGLYSDTLELANSLPGGLLPSAGSIDDDRRWWNLTWNLAESGKALLGHRLDRLNVGYTTANTVWRVGRQAVSWGNGLMFNPLDIFNPFDPAAVDKEYKSGDDMLYGQYLFAGGSDVQGVAVVRRDPLSGDVASDQSSLAFKYHGFVGMNEFDLLVAEHYDDLVLGAGGSMDVAGAVLRGDLGWTRTGRDEYFSAVASLSYSWLWDGRNVSGLVEYYHNGFGQADENYSPAALAQNPDLLQRIGRGELFALSRNYLGLSATIEMTPLFLLTPNLFVNTGDPSALLQLVAQYDWQQDLQLTAALNLPMGPDGSEYGGIASDIEGRYRSTGASLFAQLAWYF